MQLVVTASFLGVGAPEAVLVGVVALVVFGPKGLAEVRFEKPRNIESNNWLSGCQEDCGPPKDRSRKADAADAALALRQARAADLLLGHGALQETLDKAFLLMQAAKGLGKSLRAFAPTLQELTSVSRDLKNTLDEELGIDEIRREFASARVRAVETEIEIETRE